MASPQTRGTVVSSARLCRRVSSMAFSPRLRRAMSATSSTWGLGFGEAGTKFVTVNWHAYGSNAGFWDTLHNHFCEAKDDLLPVVDRAVLGLILDLELRGLLDEALVMVISQHGRTPLTDRKARGEAATTGPRLLQVYARWRPGRGN